MSIENAIKDVITESLEKGMIERLVAENLEKGINKSLENLMGSYGDITKVIEKKIKDVMVKQLESFDYSEYVVKLDCVLTEILKKTSLDNKKILENFKELMVDYEFPKVVKVSDIFEEFKKYVSKNVETKGLEIDYDDGPTYEHVSVTMEVEREEKRSWSSSSFEYAKVVFECEKDEDLNFEIRLSKFKDYGWDLETEIDTSVASLRHLDELKIYLLKLKQSSAKIEIDEDDMEDTVEVEKEPEVSFE
jgi:transcriptional regulator of heat shock response